MTEDVKPDAEASAAPSALEDLRAARAKLDQQIEVGEQKEANHAHFHDANGNGIPDADLNDAMLRACGIALEKRSKDVAWKDMSVDDLHKSIEASISTKDFIGAAFFAAVLNAKTTIGG